MSVNIKFNLNNPVQTNFLGNNAVYHGYAGMPDDAGRVYSDELCEIEADRAAELGLRVARTYYRWYAWDFKNQKWDWETETCKAFYGWLKRMKDRGIQVALNAGWCMPGDVDSTGWNAPSPFGVGATWQERVELYAKWVSESLHQLVELRGFTNITYIELFTEPQRSSPISKDRTVLDNYMLWRDCAKAVTEQLINDGRRNLVKIIGPNEGSTSTGAMNKWVAQNAAEYVDIFSSHNYQDYVADEGGAENYNPSVIFQVPGSRIQQAVDVEPNTDYVFEVEVGIKIADYSLTQGEVIIGAWDPARLKNRGIIEAGGQKVEQLTVGSTISFNSVDLPNGNQTLIHTFNSGDNTKCVVGVYRNIKEATSLFKIYSAKLVKFGNDKNLLKNPDLAQISAHKLLNFKDHIEDMGDNWIVCACQKEMSPDPYWFLRGCAHTTMEHIKNTNKPLWFDEYNVRVEMDVYDQPWHGTHLAASMQSLMNSGVQSSLMWTLFDQQWPNNHASGADQFVDGDHRYGLMPVLTRSLVPFPSYYAAGLVMKFMGGEPNTHIYEGIGKNLMHGTLAKMPDGNISLLIINNKSKSDDFVVDFGCNLGAKLKRRLYDPSTIIPDEKAKQIETDLSFDVDDILSDTLPPGGVAVYTTY